MLHGSFAIIETMNELATFSGPSADGVGGVGDTTFRLVFPNQGLRKLETCAEIVEQDWLLDEVPWLVRLGPMNFSESFAVIGIDL